VVSCNIVRPNIRLLRRLRLGEDDPPDLQQKVEMILREWINIAYTGAAAKDPANALAMIVNMVGNGHCECFAMHKCLLQMRDQGVLRTDDVITRFFRLCTEMCVEVTYRLLLVCAFIARCR
jgi:CCR4-NOT transcription complex subunit 1